MACNKCGLGEYCKNPCQMGNGTKQAKIMVIQESPYENENIRKQYMGGRAGKMFKAALGEVGIDIDDVYFTAAVKCSAMDDRLPVTSEVKACSEYLLAEIEVIQPKIIIPTGNISMKLVMGVTGITKHRGKVVDKGDYKCLPIIHPNMVLKQPKYMEFFSEDMITLGTLVNGTEVEGRPTMGQTRRYCDTYEDAIDEINRLRALPAGSIIVVDLETTKADAFKSRISGSIKTQSKYPGSLRNKIAAIGFSDRAGYGSAIPLYHRENLMPGNQIGTLVKSIRALLERPDIRVAGQNSKFELKWLRRQFNIMVDTMVYDTMLMHYLGVTEEKGTHGLDDFAYIYTDMGGYDSELNGVKPTGDDEGNYDLIPWEILKKYLAGDCDCTFRALDVFRPIIEGDEELSWLWNDLMVPAYYTLTDIESHGIYVDGEWLKKIQGSYPIELERINQRLHEFPEVVKIEREFQSRWAERVAIGQIPSKMRTTEEQFKFEKYIKYNPAKGGTTFNFGSTAQLSRLLFKEMGMHTNILTDKGNPSTNDDSLKSMRSQNPVFCSTLMEFRKVNHLNNNFVAGLPEFMDDNGYVHPSYNLHGTVTGRMSSNEPK